MPIDFKSPTTIVPGNPLPGSTPGQILASSPTSSLIDPPQTLTSSKTDNTAAPTNPAEIKPTYALARLNLQPYPVVKRANFWSAKPTRSKTQAAPKVITTSQGSAVDRYKFAAYLKTIFPGSVHAAINRLNNLIGNEHADLMGEIRNELSHLEMGPFCFQLATNIFASPGWHPAVDSILNNAIQHKYDRPLQGCWVKYSALVTDYTTPGPVSTNVLMAIVNGIEPSITSDRGAPNSNWKSKVAGLIHQSRLQRLHDLDKVTLLGYLTAALHNPAKSNIPHRNVRIESAIRFIQQDVSNRTEDYKKLARTHDPKRQLDWEHALGSILGLNKKSIRLGRSNTLTGLLDKYNFSNEELYMIAHEAASRFLLGYKSISCLEDMFRANIEKLQTKIS